ncbi:MAG: EamA family transporter [Ignavibacteriaceae bacterium]
MKDKTDIIKLVAAFAAVYTIWGSTYLAIRFAIETLPPFFMAGIRFIAAGLILFAFAMYKSPSKIKTVHWKSSFIIGGFLLLGGNGGVVWAEQFVPSGLTAVLVATVPIWVVIISWISKKGDKPSVKITSGVILGFAGLIFLINPFNINGGNVNLTGIAAILFASLSWAAGTVYTRNAVQPESKLVAIAMQMLAGGTLLFLVSLITGEISKVDIEGVSFRSFAALNYLIFFGSIIGFSSYIWLIGAAGPSRASTYAYVNPVVAIFLGWLMADEIINIRIIIATAVIIFSVAIINSNLGRNIFKRRKSKI